MHCSKSRSPQLENGSNADNKYLFVLQTRIAPSGPVFSVISSLICVNDLGTYRSGQTRPLLLLDGCFVRVALACSRRLGLGKRPNAIEGAGVHVFEEVHFD